ncbi:glycosyltransferase family 2 protein [Microbulbifer sp. TRSA001]|uniref:glycosyltransferase family 2 protein n=1 Tax=unclassified Microbulbifer TaxID=2619833 RepID=UPI00403AFBB1
MWEMIDDGITFFATQSYATLFTMFWIVVVLEFPRYLMSFFTSVFFFATKPEYEEDIESLGRLTAVIAGHNEENSIEKCGERLQEQSYIPYEVIAISDGSTDKTRDDIHYLQNKGRLDGAHATELRGGKASALNLGQRFSTGDFIASIDCDCTFDRHAMKYVMQGFADPRVGVVSGNVIVRNSTENILSSFQAIEYVISICLGRHSLAMLDQMCCASGAFSAFRVSAMNQIGGFDAGGGEDLDITFRLRDYGWKVEFAPEAICYTDVPTSITVLMRQRFRWERDAIRLRYRKYLHFINPFRQGMQLKEFFHQYEFLVFNVIAAIALPVYLIWLFVRYGENAWFILAGAQVVLIALDTITFALASYATPKVKSLPLWPYIPAYSIFYVNFMRVVRLYAYVQEWIFRTSYKDSFAPLKVHRVRE